MGDSDPSWNHVSHALDDNALPPPLNLYFLYFLSVVEDIAHIWSIWSGIYSLYISTGLIFLAYFLHVDKVNIPPYWELR